MVCKACNAELPKRAKKCPNCGIKIFKEPTNLKPFVVAGAAISLIGSLFPFIQNTGKIEDAYSYMNYSNSMYWYLFIAALVVTAILAALRVEMFSIISTIAAAIIFGITMADLSSLLSNPEYAIGCGVWIIVIGFVVAIAGVFIDIYKIFDKKPKVDARYLTNHKSLATRMYTYRWFYLMFLPVLIFILLFNYWPMLGIRYGFTDYKAVKEPVYVGLKHFVQMFTKDILFWTAFKNTLRLSIIKLIMNTSMAVVVSLLLHEITNIHFKKTVQTIVYLPHFMSWVVVASVFRLILSPSESGLVNQFLLNAGIIDEAIYFLGKEATWTPVYYIINIWKDTGWGTILFLATLSGISPDLYEAAQIDGANRWNRLCYITLPALANTIITVFILNLAKVMNLFESVFVLMNDNVLTVSNVIATLIYRKTFGQGVPNYGYTTAVGIFRSMVGCMLVLICNWASKKVRGRGIV